MSWSVNFFDESSGKTTSGMEMFSVLVRASLPGPLELISVASLVGASESRQGISVPPGPDRTASA